MPKGGIKIIDNAPEQEADIGLEPMADKPKSKIKSQAARKAEKPPEINLKKSGALPKEKTAPAKKKIFEPERTKSGLKQALGKIISILSTVPPSEKIFFAENFRVMVKAGLSLSEALETLSLQTKSKKFAGVLKDIKEGVVQGNTLASMLQKYPKIFPEYFVNMVKVGEISGNLEKNLEELSNQMKKDHDLVSKIRGAMIYPSVIVVATIGIGILMFVYVIPSVLSVFDQLNLELPLATKILILISKAINRYGFIVAPAVVIIIAALFIFSRSAGGKNFFHFIILRLWIIGPIAKKVNLARFSRTESSLLKTDIPVIESFKITSTILGNVYYKRACLAASEQLAKGAPINQILEKFPKLFPPIVTQMVSVGEKSGTLDTLLGELAAFYEEEVSDITKNLASIIEPILIVFLGGVVGLIAFAIISPIYTLSQGI